ncbi:MAG: hypothetical protein FJ128_07115 [Deltaproteobacteria bacterium]|nr:hypothetical protein [Deltaproteobacteria bacterium]MBM4285002.1 hypothetical protein [Deltaproteobacteria bacterium]
MSSLPEWSSRFWDRFKLLGLQALYTWSGLLQYRAKTKAPDLARSAPRDQAARAVFLRLIRKRQEELADFLGAYHHHCRECGGGCCRVFPVPPFKIHDYLIYDLFPERWAGITKPPLRDLVCLFTWLNPVLVICQLGRFPGNRAEDRQDLHPKHGFRPEPPSACRCAALGEQGCLLPWGARPEGCLLFNCRLIMDDLSPAAYRRFLWLMARYYALLTWALWVR